MALRKIVESVELAIRQLIQNEGGNLRRGLNELNVSTHLAFYLKPYFSDYDVESCSAETALQSNLFCKL